ncbi:MAG: hypothetical protein IMW93_09105 [Thermoanaerobacteraceae bacterium]|nr:hypothetical protein [Thermoanaerobacteraceae bacterium]
MSITATAKKTITREEHILGRIAIEGIPDPWQNFGEKLSLDGALSTYIVRKIKEARKGNHEAYNEALTLFKDKIDNLKAAQVLLLTVLEEYDNKRFWQTLDNRSSSKLHYLNSNQ